MNPERSHTPNDIETDALLSRHAADGQEQQDARTVSEERIAALKMVSDRMKDALTPEEQQSIRAILCLGSTARGTAVETSDVDLWIDWDPAVPFNADTLRRLMDIVHGLLPDVEIQIGCKPIERNTRAAFFVTKRSAKHLEEQAAWTFLYARDDEAQQSLQGILEETRANNEQRYRKRGMISPTH